MTAQVKGKPGSTVMVCVIRERATLASIAVRAETVEKYPDRALAVRVVNAPPQHHTVVPVQGKNMAAGAGHVVILPLKRGDAQRLSRWVKTAFTIPVRYPGDHPAISIRRPTT
jgi:hypothetical protein